MMDALASELSFICGENEIHQCSVVLVRACRKVQGFTSWKDSVQVVDFGDSSNMLTTCFHDEEAMICFSGLSPV
ncbi:hypothetical protein AAC387_Pa10g2193 [Persea americana]